MAKITNNGRKLALKIAPVVGTTHMIQQTCSLIARHAKTHARIQERLCGDGEYPYDEREQERIEREDERCEARLTKLIESLPEWGESDGSRGSFGVIFQGDPRGCTVKLTGPKSIYDGWGDDGICVEI